MMKFVFLSLFFHLFLFSLLFFLEFPKPPKIFHRVFIATPNDSKISLPSSTKITSIKKKITPLKVKKHQPEQHNAKIAPLSPKKIISIKKNITPLKVKKSKPEQLAFPKLVTSSSVKIKGLDLENKNFNNLKIENLEQKFTATDLELKEIQEQKPVFDFQHNQIDLDKKISQDKATTFTQEDTQSIIDTNSFTNTIDIQNYQNLLATIVRNNWDNSLQDNSLQTRVKIYISKDGDLLEYEIIKKSNVISFDLSVTNALEISPPFPPFPKTFEQDSEVFYFQFQGGGALISQ